MDAVLDHVAVMNQRYPQVKTRSSAYSFTVSDRAFANSQGVAQHEQRAYYHVTLMFAGRTPGVVTSFNGSGAAAYRPFDSFLEAGNLQRLLDETVMSFDAEPVPSKFVGDVIITPNCMLQLVGAIASSLSGYALVVSRRLCE